MDLFLDLTLKFYNGIYKLLNLEGAYETTEFWIDTMFRGGTYTLMHIIISMLLLNGIVYVFYKHANKHSQKKPIKFKRLKFVLLQVLYLNMILNVYIGLGFVLLGFVGFAILVGKIQEALTPTYYGGGTRDRDSRR